MSPEKSGKKGGKAEEKSPHIPKYLKTDFEAFVSSSYVNRILEKFYKDYNDYHTSKYAAKKRK